MTGGAVSGRAQHCVCEALEFSLHHPKIKRHVIFNYLYYNEHIAIGFSPLVMVKNLIFEVFLLLEKQRSDYSVISYYMFFS